MADTDEEGEHAPLLLSTLDFSQWTAVMTTITQEREKGMEMLKEAHLNLSYLLERDAIEYHDSILNIRKVEFDVKKANSQEEWCESDYDSAATLNGEEHNSHPMFARMHSDSAHKATLGKKIRKILMLR